MIIPAQLKQIMPFARQSHCDTYAPILNAAFGEFGINTPLRQAHFIPQIAVESGCLEWTAELSEGAAYDSRADLGNLKSSAIVLASAVGISVGAYWKGHGLIQITGYNNHLLCANYFKIPIEKITAWLQAPEGAARSACWFWHDHALNALADADDIIGITRRINGGTTGLDKRELFLASAKAILLPSDE